MPYRPCVGVVLVNKNGQVWLGERHFADNPEHNETRYLWQFPQGGIDKGEDAEPAARRELYEETNVSSISLFHEIPDWLHYDLPDETLGIALKGKYRGQKQRWFAYLFEGTDEEIDVLSPANGEHTQEFSQWRWADIDEAVALVVPFKRPVYQQVVNYLKPVIEKLQANS